MRFRFFAVSGRVIDGFSANASYQSIGEALEQLGQNYMKKLVIRRFDEKMANQVSIPANVSSAFLRYC
jgi:hypothetical protein